MSAIRVQAGLVPPAASLLGVQTPSPACVLTGRLSVCVCVLMSSSYKDPSDAGSGPTRMTHFNSVTSLEAGSANIAPA